MQGWLAAVVGQRGRVLGQLQRRDGGVALPDGRHQGQAVLVVGVSGPGQPPLRRRNFHAGVVGKAQLSGHGAESIHAQPPPGIVKENVAAVLQRGAQVHRPAVAVLQTAGVVVAVIKVLTCAVYGSGRVDARCQSCGRHSGLESRTRRIQPLADPVQQGSGAVRRKRGVVAAIAAQVKIRQAGCGQNAAGAHIHHYGGPGPDLPSGSDALGGAQGVHLVLQGGLQGLLQVGVQRQHQRTAGYRGGCLHGFPRYTVQTDVDLQLAVPPAQQGVVGGFQTVLAYCRVHRQPLGPGSGPLFGGDRPRKAQRVGQNCAIRPAAYAPRGQPHRAALHQPGAVVSGGPDAVQPLGNRQLPGRNGRTKGGKLCFHILAACQRRYCVYRLPQVRARRGGNPQVYVVDCLILGQHRAAAVGDGTPRRMLGQGVAGRTGLGHFLGVVVGHGKLQPGQPRQKQHKHGAAQHQQHHHSPPRLASPGALRLIHG